MNIEEKLNKYFNDKVNEETIELDFSYLKKIASKKLSKLTKELQNEIKKEDSTGVISKLDELKNLIEKTKKNSGMGSK